MVTTISTFWGPLAPNFMAYQSFHRLCQLTTIPYMNKIHPISITFTFKTTARSAFPSLIPTLQAFNMCFLAFYIGYRMNMNTLCRAIVQLGAVIFILVTGFVTVHLNEADHLGVWIGCLIGISSAVLTMMILRGLEGRIRKRLSPMNDHFGISTAHEELALQNNNTTTILPC